MNEAKPFNISKRLVWEAFKRVKANQGAAGVDGQSIAQFEEDLENNLYKLWNRLSSGSYFPPPVRRVEIPKMTAGFARSAFLLYPTERRRWWSECVWNRSWNPSSTKTPMLTGRESRPSRRLELRGRGAGGLTGS